MEKQERTFLKDKPKILEQIKGYLYKYRGAACFLRAFILSEASLLGYIRPFGLCYALSLDEEDRLWGCAGAFLGSLMIYGSAGMVYCAICIVALALDVFLLSKSSAREIFLPPMLGCLVMIVKCPFALYDGAGYLGLLIFEGLLAAGCSYCLLLPRRVGNGRIGQAVLAAMFIVAFADMRIFGLLSPSGIAAITLTMSATFALNSFQGAALGLAVGAFLDMAWGGSPFFAAAFGISALVSGMTPRHGRISFGLAYLLSGIACMIWGFSDPRAMGCIYDLFVAASLFLLLPDSVFQHAQAQSAGGMTPHEAEPSPASRLKELGHAIGAISRSIGEQLEREKQGEEDVSVIFDNAASSVCRNCPRSKECWIDGYMETFGWMCDMLPSVREKGHVETGDLPAAFAARCIKKDRLCACINNEYMSFLRRRAAREREKGKDMLLKEQYDGLGAAVDSLAGAARQDYMPRPLSQKQVQTILRAYGRGLRAEVFCSRGRLNMRIGPFDGLEPWVDEESFVKSAQLALGTVFLPAESVSCKEGEMLLYRERETLSALVSCAMRKKPGEEVCGDSTMYFKTEDGRALVMLSDGMGTGTEASRLSKNALELMSAFVKSGCSAWDSAGAVLPFLKARYGFWGFATLDILEIDLFTGACRMIKCGAADSYLINAGHVSVLSKPSLPPGTGGRAVPEPLDFYVKEGDRVIMASDGGDLSACPLLLRKELAAGQLIKECGDPSDDFTAIVITIAATDKMTEEVK